MCLQIQNFIMKRNLISLYEIEIETLRLKQGHNSVDITDLVKTEI